MKKIIAEIVIDETKHDGALYLAADVLESLQDFKAVNLGWSKVYSVAIDGIKCSDTKSTLAVKRLKILEINN